MCNYLDSERYMAHVLAYAVSALSLTASVNSVKKALNFLQEDHVLSSGYNYRLLTGMFYHIRTDLATSLCSTLNQTTLNPTTWGRPP